MMHVSVLLSMLLALGNPRKFPPPPLISTRLRVMASPHPRGDIAKMAPTPGGPQRTRYTKEEVVQTPGHMIHKMTRNLPVGMRVQLF